jgi:peroxidase
VTRNFPAFNHFWKFKPFMDFDDVKGHSLIKYWVLWGHHGVNGHWHGKHHQHHGHKKPFEATQENHLKDYSALLLEEARNEDGTGNNETNTDWGSAGSSLLRASYASYGDDIGDVGDDPPPFGANPRDISNAILDQDTPMPSSFGNSDLFTYFGQFIDHDIDLTPEGHSEIIHFTHPDAGGGFGIFRSAYQPGTGTSIGDPREYPNVITSHVDASNIYGSHEDVTNLLRADGGNSPYLHAGADGYLPTFGELEDLYGPLENLVNGPLVAVPGDNMFVAGDVRANENNALTSLHTMWAREHNYQVDKLKDYMPNASNDELFKAARLIVEAEYQNVVFNEYLPQLLGAENIPEYLGYNSAVNPGVTIEFSTAAFRLGHSQVSSTLHRLDEDGGTADGGHLGLFQAFFNPTQLMNGGIDALVRGLGAFRGQEIDENIVDDVRNLLFGGSQGGADPLDLGVLNLLRSYDHGVPTLNEVRMAYGLAPLMSFADLTSDTDLQMQFANAYTNDINAVDLWVGGLGEDNLTGSQLGETFHTIVLDQFMALRDGDRFYFEERMEDHPELLAMIKDTSFSDIIVRTTGIEYFQDDAFIAHNRIGGTDGSETLGGTDDHDLMIGFGDNDTLYGNEGDDDLYGGDGNDRLFGGDGRDVIYGEDGDDKAWGGDGNDHLSGGLGNDMLYGDAGNDTIDGGPGQNTMFGGSGADVFVLSDFDAKDFLADYEMQDTIDLTGLFDILDTDGTAGLSQGDVDNALKLAGGDLSARNPTDDLFDTIAHIHSAGGGHPFQVTVLVDDDSGTEGTFTV